MSKFKKSQQVFWYIILSPIRWFDNYVKWIAEHDSPNEPELAELIGAFSYYNPGKAERLKQLLKAHDKYVIGEDEKVYHDDPLTEEPQADLMVIARNMYRAEQRKRAGE